jgi:hypothetical protein
MALGLLQPGETQLDGQFSELDPYRFYSDIEIENSPEAKIKLASRDEAIRIVLGLGNVDFGARNYASLYLVGWQEDSPVPVELANKRSDRLDETLLVVELPFAPTNMPTGENSHPDAGGIW